MGYNRTYVQQFSVEASDCASNSNEARTPIDVCDEGAGFSSDNISALYHCRVCQAPFSDIVSLQLHTRFTHKGIASKAFEKYGFADGQIPFTHEFLMSDGPSLLKCQHCDASFTNILQFTDHMRLFHLLPTSLINSKCEICCEIIPDTQKRLMHLVEHLGSTTDNYRCNRCLTENKFAKMDDYRRHFLLCHTDILYRCEVCLKVFTQQSTYEDHIMTHASNRLAFSCVLCTLSFASYEQFFKHVVIKHDTSGRKDFIATPLAEKPHPVPSLRKRSSMHVLYSMKTVKCSVCDKQFENETRLDEHRLHNHCKVPSSDRCSICRTKLLDVTDFVRHSYTHSNVDGCVGGTLSCIICRQTIRSEDLLRIHGNYHLCSDDKGRHEESGGLSAVSCDSQKLFDNEILASILRVAAEDGGHCNEPVGSSRFSPENAVTRFPTPLSPCVHEASDRPNSSEAAGDLPNNDERRPSAESHVCVICGETFDERVCLDTHALAHINNNNRMSDGSANKNELGTKRRKLKRRQSGDLGVLLTDETKSTTAQSSDVLGVKSTHKCPECSKCFLSLIALQGHSHVHMGVRNFRCAVCAQCFSSPGRLSAHRKRDQCHRHCKCRICDAQFATHKQLVIHSKMHAQSITSCSQRFASDKIDVLS